jgi:CIC family chloride channel protein
MKDQAVKILRYLSGKTVALVERAKMTEYTFMIVIALIIGVLAGFGAILIRTMIMEISSFSFPGTADLLTNITENPWFRKLTVPALGGLIVGPLIYFFAREAKGHGVPEVMQAIIARGGVIRPRVAVVKAIASAVTIGTGGSVGREGPIVQIGSSIGSAVGQFFRVSSQRLKTFVGCGAAAGIAAAFNAPVAGALFSVEIILQDFAFAHFSPIVVSSVMATVVSHAFEGDFAAFQVPAYKLTSPYELIFYFVLAALSALVGHIFIRVLYYSEDFFDERFRFPEYLKPVIGGFIIGAGALFFPEIMGVGYESINSALHGNTIWYMALLLLFIKVLATSITLGSGGSGGIFAPSLFLGAMTGVFFGGIVHSYFPEISSDPGAYALVAMGGLISATTYAPITAIVMVFELTNDYQIILPLMITCIMSTIISLKLSRESIYTKKLVNRNILVKDGTDSNVMKGIMVKDVYTDKVDTIDDHMKFDEVINHVVASHERYFPVANRRGTISGIISINDIKEHLYDREMLQHVLIAEDISNKFFETVTPGDNCQDALDIMSRHDLDGLPVVKSAKSKKLIGMVWRKDIVDEYNREIEKRDITTSFASRITMKNIDSHVHFMEGYAITEIPVPGDFLGKSIQELNIRKKYGVDILLIRCNLEGNSKIKAMPNPDYRFSINDSLVIAGEIGKLNLMKSL